MNQSNLIYVPVDPSTPQGRAILMQYMTTNTVAMPCSSQSLDDLKNEYGKAKELFEVEKQKLELWQSENPMLGLPDYPNWDSFHAAKSNRDSAYNLMSSVFNNQKNKHKTVPNKTVPTNSVFNKQKATVSKKRKPPVPSKTIDEAFNEALNDD